MAFGLFLQHQSFNSITYFVPSYEASAPNQNMQNIEYFSYAFTDNMASSQA
jgi:hypothetical protein